MRLRRIADLNVSETRSLSHHTSTPDVRVNPWRTFAFVLVAAMAFCGCVNRQRTPIGGHWEIVTETSGIPEAGGHHPFLHRNSERVKVRVDTDTYSYRFIPPDSVLWIGMDNGGLWIATGDHEPLLLKTGLGFTDRVPSGDPIDLGPPWSIYPVAHFVEIAAKKPLLTSSWKPRARNER
jgi:hypothetical protein